MNMRLFGANPHLLMLLGAGLRQVRAAQGTRRPVWEEATAKEGSPEEYRPAALTDCSRLATALMQLARGSDWTAWVSVVVQRGDPAPGQLRFGSVRPFYAESVLRWVFPLYGLGNGTAARAWV